MPIEIYISLPCIASNEVEGVCIHKIILFTKSIAIYVHFSDTGLPACSLVVSDSFWKSTDNVGGFIFRHGKGGSITVAG